MIEQDIAGLIQKALEAGLIEPADVNYARNQVMNLLGLESFPEEATAASGDSIPDLLEKLAAYAVEHGVITDDLDAKDMLAANVMNCFVARPSVINAVFQQKYEQSPLAATEYFYQLSKNSNYIQTKRIEKIFRIRWIRLTAQWILRSICQSRKKTLNKSNGNAPLQNNRAAIRCACCAKKTRGMRDESGILPGQTTGLLKSRSPEKTGIFNILHMLTITNTAFYFLSSIGR